MKIDDESEQILFSRRRIERREILTEIEYSELFARKREEMSIMIEILIMIM